MIDQGLPVAPKTPKSPPSEDGPVDGAPVSDEPTDLIEEPGASVPEPQTTPATPAPEAPPAAPADDTGMDDTAAGGLDDTDLGAPVDATDQGVDATPPPAPGATPPAPDATPPAPSDAG